MKGLIIAAGQGRRLSAICSSKPLLPVGGQPLINWVIRGLVATGINEVVVITGYNREKLEDHLQATFSPEEVKLTTVYNDRWSKENGLSVYMARPLLEEPFFLLMSDHIFDPAILKLMLKEDLKEEEVILAVDYRIQNHPYVDLNDVTRVLVKEGKIRDIGKGLSQYNAFDTGIFLCQPVLFEALEQSQKLGGDYSLSGGIRVLAARGQARAVDVGHRFWIDIDDPKALEKVENYLSTKTNCS